MTYIWFALMVINQNQVFMNVKILLVHVLVLFCIAPLISQDLAHVSSFPDDPLHRTRVPDPDFFPPSSFSLCTISCGPDVTINSDPGDCTAAYVASDVSLEGDCC